MEKKDEEELDSWSLKHGPIRNMVGYLEGEKRRLLRIKLCHLKSISSIF